MMASQRKAHRFIWLGMALVIPVLLYFAVRNLTFIHPTADAPPSEILNAKLGAGEITITLNRSFKSASAVVYGFNKEGRLGSPLGQLLEAGTYSFKTSDGMIGFVVVDMIKEQELYKVKF